MAHRVSSPDAGPFFVLPPRTFPELEVDNELNQNRRLVDAVAEARAALARFAYLRPPEPSSSNIVELLKANPLIDETFGIRAVARGSDGLAPVRAL